jgi:hypothetical protein
MSYPLYSSNGGPDVYTSKSPLLVRPPIPVQAQKPPEHTVVIVRSPDTNTLATSLNCYSAVKLLGIIVSIVAIIVLIVALTHH